MQQAFGQSSITSINLSGSFSTENVTNIQQLFYNCQGLKTIIGIEDWNVSKLQNMTSTFSLCYDLQPLDLSKWNTASLTNLNGTFTSCFRGLTSINLSGWNTSNVTNMNNLFNGCSVLEEINLSEWDMTKATAFNTVFNGTTVLTNINMEDSNVTSVNKVVSVIPAKTADVPGTIYVDTVTDDMDVTTANSKYWNIVTELGDGGSND